MVQVSMEEVVDSAYIKTISEDLKLNNLRKVGNHYVLPLASVNFGEDSIALRRLRNKSLKITFGKSSVLSVNELDVNIYVTAVGFRNISYVGGSCSLLLG